MVLTRDNYYTPEADWAYMSCSQYQGWRECEAKQLAKLQGRWVDEPKEAFLVGNYFHTYFESPEAHEQFIMEHEEEIFLKQTKAEAAAGIRRLRAPYELANKMIATAEADPMIKSLLAMDGENEMIMTGEIFGVPWRIRLDKYVAAGRLIIDYKTVANIWEQKWNDEAHAKVSFLEAYEYLMRAAVYAEIEKQYTQSATDPQFLIIAISKQDPPDKEILSLNHRQRWDFELEKIKERLPYIQAVKEGRMRPRRCGMCEYCRATKRIEAIRPYYALMPEFREAKEDEVDAEPMLHDTLETGELGGVSAVQDTDCVGQDGHSGMDAMQ